MIARLETKGLAVAHVLFEGEHPPIPPSGESSSSVGRQVDVFRTGMGNRGAGVTATGQRPKFALI
jgi:hypothetical protein